MVQVTNEANETFFGGPRWNEIADTYEMEAEQKCVLYLDNCYNIIYFMYRHPDYSGSESSDHDPRDEDIDDADVIVFEPDQPDDE